MAESGSTVSAVPPKPPTRSTVLPFSLGAAVAGIATGIFAGFVAFDRSDDVEALRSDLQAARTVTDLRVAAVEASMAAELEASLKVFDERISETASGARAQIAEARESADRQVQETRAELKRAREEIVALKARKESEAIVLFNGKDLDGWDGVGGEPTNWGVEEGLLVCKGVKGAKWLSTRETYSDFDLTLDFRLPKGGNSGVFIRTSKTGNPAHKAMEIQVIDDKSYSEVRKAELKEWQHTGSIYAVVPPSRDMARPAGEWNQMRIICQGAVVRVYLNGQEIVNADMDGYEQLRKRPREGYIGLQNHGSRLEFRNIVLRRL